MTNLVVENLSPPMLTQLEALAQLHGRSLQEEIQHILHQAIQNQLPSDHTGGDFTKAQAAVAAAQMRYAGHTFSDSAELIREDRDR